MKNKYDLGFDVFNECVDFNKETGTFTFKDKPSHIEPREQFRKIFNSQFSGKPAFAVPNSHGYLEGGFMGHKYMAHRVAYLMTHGKWPDGDIDHINGITTDNRPCNLRDVTPSENLRNMKRNKANRSGHTGVFWSKGAGKWTAQIREGGKALHLGYFESKDAAVAAREAANKTYNYHFNHGKRD